MKIFSILTLSLTLATTSFAQTAEQKPIEDRDISKFNQRLETIYRQSDDDTLLQQVIFGSLEAIAAYKLSSFVTPVDQKKIASLTLQIKALKDPSSVQSIGGDHYSENHKAAKIRSLQRELKAVEGGIFKRMGRGTVRILTRGAQVFLILDVGSRIYILNSLDNRDPGFVPAYTFLCNQVDCVYAVEEVIDTSNEAYLEARRAMQPRRSIPPAAHPVEVTPPPTTPPQP